MQPNKKPANMLLKYEYKSKLDTASRQLSAKYDERVTIVSIVYKLIDNYLEQALADIEHDMTHKL